MLADPDGRRSRVEPKAGKESGTRGELSVGGNGLVTCWRIPIWLELCRLFTTFPSKLWLVDGSIREGAALVDMLPLLIAPKNESDAA